jgi:hypothetical protein
VSSQVYALLVGINAYPPEVGALSGCVNDVDHFHDYLVRNVDKSRLGIQVLKDAEATRDQLIRAFRDHLGQAGPDDVAVFHFCGHGARWASAKAFLDFYPDGKDEGLVCIDSRGPGGYDLADKELAVLIAEVADRGAHVAVILDCCHSGSGTRGVDAFRGLRARVTHEVTQERPLESYLDGHYARLSALGTPLWIPASSHILLAACERTQLAQESPDNSGVFTSTLIEVLNKSGGDLTYADLFMRCRAAVHSRADDQNPQFETAGSFSAASGFLGRRASQTARRYSVYCEQGRWRMDAGAIQGVPTDPDKPVALRLYPEDDQARVAGSASTVQVGPQKSEITLGFASPASVRYRAEITSLPVPPLLVSFDGPAIQRDTLQQTLGDDGSVGVALTDVLNAGTYVLREEEGRLLLLQCETDLVVQGAGLGSGLEPAARLLLPALKQVAQWERGLGLRNPGTAMDVSLVDFHYAERLAGAAEHVHAGDDIVLDLVKSGRDWAEIRGAVRARNRTAQTLHLALVYFSREYGIHILSNDPLEPGERWATLWGADPKDYFYLDDGLDESVERFKLIVSTEKIDDFLLSQDDLVLGHVESPTREAQRDGTRGIGSVRSRQKLVHQNEWFTRDLRIRVVRRLDAVGQQDLAIAGGQIVVKAHPKVQAQVSLASAKTVQATARGTGDASAFCKAFERQGLALLNFSTTRGDPQNILELTDIQQASSLAEEPLEIVVKVPLQAGEGLLALVCDGQHVLLGGDASLDDDGHTHVTIDHLPDIGDRRRSLGGSLKLYFFKTWLRQDNVNQLRRVEFDAQGTSRHEKSGVAERVAAAQNILLLVHGIIGDTEGMCAGVQACGLDRTFDLVLAYDYENLSTPIADTARQLKAQLAAVGLQAGDGKHLTLLVHSMGGLVSRWFIEREGGHQVVDHLVMCGTPNHGSPFGKFDGARKILNVLTGLTLNYVPVLVPFSSAVMLLLNRSKRVTPTLEQMNPDADFIRTLNASPDPGIPYTILAGDVDAYQEPSDAFFARMLVKAGKGPLFDALFANQPNDIAVGVQSILGVGAERALAPVRHNVACHHLNYFVSAAGQEALRAVRWQGGAP